MQLLNVVQGGLHLATFKEFVQLLHVVQVNCKLQIRCYCMVNDVLMN